MSTVFEEIKDRVDLMEIVSRSVQLKRVGHSYRGLCPFHNEKTPSFYVRPETNRWHCFGCSKRGDVFDWYVEQGIPFKDVLSDLAQTAGITLDDHSEQQRDHERRLRAMLEFAERFYRGQLQSDVGRPARLYLRERGLTPETWAHFGLGYARANRSLATALQSEGFSKEDCLASGLVISVPGMPYGDFFRNRIVFPIWNQAGKIIAFGGRALTETMRSKYLNTKETPLFRKHEVLYGINLAAKAIAERRQAIVVEGNIDVMTAHQHGETNVVATMGTAISDHHVKRLASMADEIVLAMDADTAGTAAVWRSLQRAEEALRNGSSFSVNGTSHSSHSCDLKIMQLPAGQDPDDFIRHHPDQWSTLEHKPVVDYALDRIAQTVDVDSAASIEDATRSIANVLVWVSNPVVRARYIQRAADILDVDELDIRESLRKTRVLEGVQHDEQPEADELQAWDDYALALYAATGLPINTFPFARGESRAFAAFLADSGVISEAPAEFSAIARRIAPLTSRLIDLPAAQQRDELRTVRCMLSRQQLFAQRAEVLSVLRDADDAGERVALAQRYADVTNAIVESDAQIARSER